MSFSLPDQEGIGGENACPGKRNPAMREEGGMEVGSGVGRTQPKPVCLYPSSPSRLGEAPSCFLCLFVFLREAHQLSQVLRVICDFPTMASFSWAIFGFHFLACAPSLVLPGVCPGLLSLPRWQCAPGFSDYPSFDWAPSAGQQ